MEDKKHFFAKREREGYLYFPGGLPDVLTYWKDCDCVTPK